MMVAQQNFIFIINLQRISSTYLMKYSLDIKMASLDFIITPIHISFKNTQSNSYFVEFCKGAQILHKFDEPIIINSTHKKHNFTLSETGKFKLLSERSFNCEWAVYKMTSNQMNQFIDSLPISFLDYYNNYINSLKANQEIYLKITSDHSRGQQISKNWKALKESIAWQHQNIFAKNRNQSIQICFNLQIKSQMDTWQHLQKQKSVKSISTIRSSVNLKKNLQDDLGLSNRISLISHQMQAAIQEVKAEVQESKPQVQQSRSQTEIAEQIQISKPPTLPLHSKQSVLSDIIECSNENSSNLNFGDRRQHLKQISGIPQEQSQIYSPIPNTKTQHFDAKYNLTQDGFKKRSNTYDSISEHNDGTRISLPEPPSNFNDQNHDYDQYLEKQELKEMETTPHSQMTVIKQKDQEVKTEVGMKKKWILVILLFLILGGASTAAYLKFRNSAAKPSKSKTEATRSRHQEAAKKPKGKKSK